MIWFRGVLRMQGGAGLSTAKDVLHSQAPQDSEQ